MGRKSEQLQIRVSARQKAMLRRLSKSAGQDVSAYVLGRVLHGPGERLVGIVESLKDDDNRRYALAELNDVLASLAASELAEAVGALDLHDHSPLIQNYVAAMVDHGSHRRGISPPAWTRDVIPLEEPYFATPLVGLRLHLLRSSPIAFKRRNIFVDASVGDRV